jgi:hypothetical protein
VIGCSGGSGGATGVVVSNAVGEGGSGDAVISPIGLAVQAAARRRMQANISFGKTLETILRSLYKAVEDAIPLAQVGLQAYFDYSEIILGLVGTLILASSLVTA